MGHLTIDRMIQSRVLDETPTGSGAPTIRYAAISMRFTPVFCMAPRLLDSRSTWRFVLDSLPPASSV